MSDSGERGEINIKNILKGKGSPNVNVQLSGGKGGGMGRASFSLDVDL